MHWIISFIQLLLVGFAIANQITTFLYISITNFMIIAQTFSSDWYYTGCLLVSVFETSQNRLSHICNCVSYLIHNPWVSESVCSWLIFRGSDFESWLRFARLIFALFKWMITWSWLIYVYCMFYLSVLFHEVKK